MKKRQNKKNILKNPWTYVIMILIIIGIFWVQALFPSSNLRNTENTGNTVISGNIENTGNTGTPETDAFAQCVTESGIKMYGTEWCGYCKKQKLLFGSSFEYIDYTDCDLESTTCSTEGVQGYPTWKINGESYPGVQQFTRLAQLTGCELP